ncbi:MAG: hypothetical protein PHQ64_00535 [Bacilli bacterium]|nr:hypothetical protein [Bacilli bacterium]
MKKHNTLKVILLSIVVLFLFTWIFPGAAFNSELTLGNRNQMGIFDLISYPSLTLTYFGYILVYVLLIGGFYGVAHKIPAYRKALDKIVKLFHKKEALLLSLISVLVAIFVSVTGLSIGVLFFFPFIIALVLLMGYNKLVAASVTAGATAVGLIGTTFGSQTVNMINNYLSTTVYTEIAIKVLLLVLGLCLLIFNTLRYAKNVKSKVDQEENIFVPEKIKATEAKKTNSVFFAVIFGFISVLMIVAFLPWESVFKITWFADALTAIKGFEIASFPVFSKVLGTSLNQFGNWSLSSEMLVALFIMTVLLGLIYKVKFNDFIESFIGGMKRAVYPAALMLLVYTCLIIVTFNPFQLFITDFLLNLTKGFNVVTMTFVAFISSLFNVESAYAAQSTLPYLITVVTDKDFYSLIALIFQAIYGLTMLVVPTSVVLVGVLSYLEISYTQWLKHIWKLFLELLVLLLIVFIILLVI